MENKSKQPTAADAELQLKIVALVGEFNDLEEAVPDLNRRLCRLARAHPVSAEAFRSRLVQAGLASSRASELHVVLLARTECDAFLAADRPEGPQSWEVTLAQARLEYLRVTYGLSAADVLAARVAGWFHRTHTICLPVAGGLLTIAERSGDLESLANVAQPQP